MGNRATTKGTRAGSNHTVRVRVLVLFSCSTPTLKLELKLNWLLSTKCLSPTLQANLVKSLTLKILGSFFFLV